MDAGREEEESVKWLDIQEHYAGSAAEKRKSFSSKGIDAIQRSVLLSGAVSSRTAWPAQEQTF